MAFLNSWRVFLLATISILSYMYMRNTDTVPKRMKRDLLAWYKHPTKCVDESFRQVSLTFDEGPSVYTDQVLDALAANNIKATFHFQTGYLDNPKYIQSLQRAYKDGHLIGLRWNPQLPMPTSMSINDFTNALLKQSNDLAYWMGANVYPKFLRMPWPEVNDEINAALETNGFIVTGWNQDPVDWSLTATSDPDFIGNIIKTNATLTKSQIVLLHDIFAPAAATLNNTLTIVNSIPTTTGATDLKVVRLDACLGVKDAYRTSNGGVNTPVPSSPGTSVPQTTGTNKPAPTTTAKSGTKPNAGFKSAGSLVWPVVLGLVATVFVFAL